jgi:hypothetical protein
MPRKRQKARKCAVSCGLGQEMTTLGKSFLDQELELHNGPFGVSL